MSFMRPSRIQDQHAAISRALTFYLPLCAPQISEGLGLHSQHSRRQSQDFKAIFESQSDRFSLGKLGEDAILRGAEVLTHLVSPAFAQRGARLNSLVGVVTDVSCAGPRPILTFVGVVPTAVESRRRRNIFLYAVACLGRRREDPKGRAESYCDEEGFGHIYLPCVSRSNNSCSMCVRMPGTGSTMVTALGCASSS
jgi:hypothetical protein